MERRAETAERELVKLKLLTYLSTRLGVKLDAVITGVADYGFFAQAEQFPAEGLVHISSLTDDYYHFDEEHAHALTAGGRKTRYRLGDRVRVEVARVDLQRRMLDFRLAPTAKGGAAAARRGRAAAEGEEEAARLAVALGLLGYPDADVLVLAVAGDDLDRRAAWPRRRCRARRVVFSAAFSCARSRNSPRTGTRVGRGSPCSCVTVFPSMKIDPTRSRFADDRSAGSVDADLQQRRLGHEVGRLRAAAGVRDRHGEPVDAVLFRGECEVVPVRRGHVCCPSQVRPSSRDT